MLFLFLSLILYATAQDVLYVSKTELMSTNCYATCQETGAKYVVYYPNDTCQCLGVPDDVTGSVVELNLTQDSIVQGKLRNNNASNFARDSPLQTSAVEKFIGVTFPETVESVTPGWGAWTTAVPCNAPFRCGMCGTMTQNRTCLAEPCKGLATRTLKCPVFTCTLPLDTCCRGYSKQLNIRLKIYTCQLDV
ncbi:unnamed protein product, partial [Mesorhabditis spiculigera]